MSMKLHFLFATGLLTAMVAVGLQNASFGEVCIAGSDCTTYNCNHQIFATDYCPDPLANDQCNSEGLCVNRKWGIQRLQNYFACTADPQRHCFETGNCSVDCFTYLPCMVDANQLCVKDESSQPLTSPWQRKSYCKCIGC